MNDSFQRLMSDAASLTRSGDLRAATAAIQAGLGGTSASLFAAVDDAAVIEGEAREIKADGPHIARPVAATREFIAGNYADAAGTLDYKLFIPPGNAGQALPLVLMLHGCTQSPDDFALGTDMNERARTQGFFVLYPAQAQGANPSRCWNWFKRSHQQRDLGEPAALANMTRDVIRHHNIDPTRVYVAGLSAGGAMAAILGDAYPDLFAAVGVHSGLPTGSARDVQSAFAVMKGGAASAQIRSEPDAASHRTPPTIVFHGDQDKTVHPGNGEQVVAASVGTVVPEVDRVRSDNGRDYTRRIYREADGRVMAEYWAVHGAGHAWSGGSAKGSYTDAKGPSATDEMLRFFFENTLRTVS